LSIRALSLNWPAIREQKPRFLPRAVTLQSAALAKSAARRLFASFKEV
jgi:hypothetical protein